MTTPPRSDNMTGNMKRKMRHAARFFAVQALFQMEHSDLSVDRVRIEFLNHRFGELLDGQEMLEGDEAHFTRVLEGVVAHQAAIDQSTDRALVQKWPIARLDPTLRALFRAAGAEFRDKGIPPKVVIAEYLDIAASFFPDGKETRFVNAILDFMAREARPETF
ncbi:transcription antitermination factor NusB [Sulfitobacter sp. HNIBRBA3233]|uniref:transcription antitermination factor NusB n=1 Tax=Sulfitobacter marinivivus TaxID=3158558 RepID=UPI0032DF4D63